MFERPEGGEQAVMVHVDFRVREDREQLEELRELAVSAGVLPVAVITASRNAPDANFFIGHGKADEIRQQLRLSQANLVLFNHSLTPGQERNLESYFQCRVLDRTGLILDIFAQRARSFEGKLQVELAQLRHLSTRLVRGWSHLERQKGGIGLRGPGEKQLETDRRLIGARIRNITRRLEKVRRQRGVRRASRRKAAYPVVSLVGYTNAGKSMLFNRVTGSEVTVADQLFATLDPTLRRLYTRAGHAVILADTVGFIRHLPHDLIAAFQSTLEETREADLLLHVVDASDPDREAKIEQVNCVLAEIGADQVPQVLVLNKIDRLDGVKPRVERGPNGEVASVWLSARRGDGLDGLLETLDQRVLQGTVRRSLRLPLTAGRLRARLFEAGAVVSELQQDAAWILEVQVQLGLLERLCRSEGYTPEAVAGAGQAQ